MNKEQPAAKKGWGQEGSLGTESPGEFLARLSQKLREQDNVDAGLADILSTHLLTAEPSFDAVSKAKAAILRLARSRATPPESVDGNA